MYGEACVNIREACVNVREACVNIREACVNIREACVDIDMWLGRGWVSGKVGIGVSSFGVWVLGF